MDYGPWTLARTTDGALPLSFRLSRDAGRCQLDFVRDVDGSAEVHAAAGLRWAYHSADASHSAMHRQPNAAHTGCPSLRTAAPAGSRHGGQKVIHLPRTRDHSYNEMVKGLVSCLLFNSRHAICFYHVLARGFCVVRGDHGRQEHHFLIAVVVFVVVFSSVIVISSGGRRGRAVWLWLSALATSLLAFLWPFGPLFQSLCLGTAPTFCRRRVHPPR